MQIINEIAEAIQDEIRALQERYRDAPITVHYLRSIKVGQDYYYEGIITNFEDGDLLGIPEGVSIRIIYKEWDSLLREYIDRRREGRLLYYSLNKHHIIFSVSGEHIELPDKHKRFRIEPTAEDFARAMKKRLWDLNSNPSALSWQILLHNYRNDSIPYPVHDLPKSHLNQSQADAIDKMFTNDITFLWGPPGTGKTTTIATAIREMCRQGKKVLAVAMSNIAVDQIALKCIEAADYPLPQKGEIIRFGYSRLEAVKQQDVLFPAREKIEQIRKEMGRLESELKRAGDPIKLARLRHQLSSCAIALKRATVEPIHHALVTLTTAIQVCLIEDFREIEFDVVVVDEASMISLPLVAVLGAVAKEKLVIAGDHQQLAPIALAESPLAQTWLHRDVFDIAGVIATPNHPALAMLTQQHRMHESICEIISDTFYQSRLTSHLLPSNRVGALLPPTRGRAVEFLSITVAEGSRMQKTDNHSRYNLTSSDLVIETLSKILRQPEKPTIGIITPYRAQAHRISRLVKEAGERSANPNYRKVKVGTVHAFQGDECDIILFDLVDTSEDGPGRLYRGVSGERLVNVAISRARGKIVLIGDPKLFDVEGNPFPLLRNLVDKFFTRNLEEIAPGAKLSGVG